MDDTLYLKCRCGLFTDGMYLMMVVDDCDQWVSAVQFVPLRTWGERIKSAWKVLRGEDEGYTAEVLLEMPEVEKLETFLAEFKKRVKDFHSMEGK